jgi:thymidylate synthase (FAD)
LETITLLDHGYIKPIEHWGSDERIIEAARMSTGKGFLGWGDDNNPGDEKLLAYLWKNKHTTPFEMAGMTVEVQAPIFVFREWHRHRTQSYNEMSARYIPLPDVNYIPSIERIMMDGGSNKQAQSTGAILNEKDADDFRRGLKMTYNYAQKSYEGALQCGVPKELARLVLPVGRYSRMRASANLLNWLRFLKLRLDSHAQWEIRQYAIAVKELLVDSFPRTLRLFTEEING